MSRMVAYGLVVAGLAVAVPTIAGAAVGNGRSDSASRAPTHEVAKESQTALASATVARQTHVPPVGPTSWVKPVAGPILRPFIAPATPYGPGHRGVDFGVAVNTPVRAAGAGRVIFAGRVAGVLHIVVLHPASQWRTGYSFLDTARVRAGDWVAGGQVIGTAGSDRTHRATGSVHVSLRIDGGYVDPMALWSPPDLAAVVHLDRFR